MNIMRGRVFFSFFVVLALQFQTLLANGHGNQTLVLHDGSIDFEKDYTLFFQDYTKNFPYAKLVYKNVKDEGGIKIVSDVDHEQNLYKNIILFPITGRGLGKKLTSADLVKFAANRGGSILAITSDKSASDEVRIFLNQLGIYPSPKQYKLHDHFSYVKEEDNKQHDVLSLPLEENFLDTDNVIVEPTLKADNALYSGASALLSNNELLIPILSAPQTSFNYNPKKLGKKSTEDDAKYVNDVNYWGLGNQNFLIVAFQNLANSRVSWIGSETFLTDDYYKNSNYKNEKIANDLLKWTFGEKNVLRIDFVEFYKTANNTFNPKLLKDTFKVKDEVVYNFGISEYKDQQWQPYEADDVQLEFTMLDPYYRLTLSKVQSDSKVLSINNLELQHKETNTTFYSAQLKKDLSKTQFYSTKFVLPDQHGMFKYLVNYQKPGYSFLHSENVITLRNLANDEYEKSWEIVNSWVYLSAIVTLIVGWFIFLNLFIFGSDARRVTTAKKNN